MTTMTFFVVCASAAIWVLRESIESLTAAMLAFNTALADVLDLGAHPVEIDDLHQLLWYFKGGFSERGGTAPCT